MVTSTSPPWSGSSITLIRDCSAGLDANTANLRVIRAEAVAGYRRWSTDNLGCSSIGSLLEESRYGRWEPYDARVSRTVLQEALGATPEVYLPGVPSMFNSLGVQVPYPARWRRRISEAQGRRREAGSERSVEQTYEPMNKNQIRGIACGTSGPRTTKSISIKHTSCRSGGCVRKAVELTSGDLPFAVRSRLRVERSILTGRQKSAEGVLAGQPGEGPNGPAQAG
jgi:hypothetical protein